MRTLTITLAILFTFQALAQQTNSNDTISLFNGKDLSGWHIDVPEMDTNPDARNPFVVREGMLVSLGTPGGHLISDSIYRDYRLEVEYRFAGKPGNCGVLVHASTPRALYGMFPKSMEVQMQHEHAGDFWCIVEDITVPDMVSRRGPEDKWGIVEGKNRRIENLTDGSEKPVGEWNSMVIECRGDEVKVWVNGELVNYGYNCTASEGHIALQAEGSEVEFRKVELSGCGLRVACCGESKTFVYKEIDTAKLKLEVLYPAGLEQGRVNPAIIFFFGGGWSGGTIEHFRPQAEYLITRGMIAVLADYRVKNSHGTTPFDALADAKSAIRFLRANARELGIDSERIVASGGSAGGHLAAATALVEGFDDPTDDKRISCIPDALVLFNPVVDNGPGGYGYERIGDQYKDFSPLHNIRTGAPPTLFLLGTEDELIPVETGHYYKKTMERVGSRCDLKLYEGAGHGFFNPRNPVFYYKTLEDTKKFLESMGYLEPST